MIQLVNIELSKGKKVNFAIQKKSFSCLLVEKENRDYLLNVLARIKKTKGNILIEGQSLVKSKEQVYKANLKKYGVIYSDFKFVSYKNVYENFKYYLELRGYPKEKIDKTIESGLDFFRMKDKMMSEIAELTKEEKAVLEVARAILTEPNYLIVDEIHLDLEKPLRDKIFGFLKKVSDAGMGILYLTADKEFAKSNHMTIYEGVK